MNSVYITLHTKGRFLQKVNWLPLSLAVCSDFSNAGPLSFKTSAKALNELSVLVKWNQFPLI